MARNPQRVDELHAHTSYVRISLRRTKGSFMNRFRRTGLTVVEVIIVALIGLILLGFVLVFLGRGREASQRLECANHLRVLGQAIYHYHGSKERPGTGQLPPARIADGYATWPIPLGPFLAATDAFANWDVRKSYVEQTAAAREVTV